MNKRQRKKQRKLDEDVTFVRAWMQGRTYFSGRQVVHGTGISIGRVRHILHIMNRQGEIKQTDRTNHVFGSVYRGDLRVWRVRPASSA